MPLRPSPDQTSAATADSLPDAALPTADRDLHRMVVGGSMSTFGSALTGVTLAVIAVDRLHITGTGAGLLAAASALPNLAFGLYAGALADRIHRPRRILVAIELLAGSVVLAAAAALAAGGLNLGFLIGVELAAGVLGCAGQSLFFTHLSSVVGTSSIGVARARLQSASYSASALANASAGALVRVLTPTVALLVDVVSYLYSAMSLRRVQAPDQNPALVATSPAGTTADAEDPKPRGGIHHEIAEGVRVLLHSPVRSILYYAIVAQVAFAGAGSLRAIYLLRTLHLPVVVYGVPGLAAALLGSAGSALAVRFIRRDVDAGRLAAACWAAGALAACALPAAAGPAPVVLLVATGGIALPIMLGAAANVAVVTLLGHHIEPRVMGRVNAAFMVTVSFATIAGSLAAGRAADVLDVRTALWITAVVGLAGLVLLVPMVRRAHVQCAGVR